MGTKYYKNIILCLLVLLAGRESCFNSYASDDKAPSSRARWTTLPDARKTYKNNKKTNNESKPTIIVDLVDEEPIAKESFKEDSSKDSEELPQNISQEEPLNRDKQDLFEKEVGEAQPQGKKSVRKKWNELSPNAFDNHGMKLFGDGDSSSLWGRKTQEEEFVSQKNESEFFEINQRLDNIVDQLDKISKMMQEFQKIPLQKRAEIITRKQEKVQGPKKIVSQNISPVIRKKWGEK